MKNEPHVIGDRVPDEHDLIAELKLAPQSTPNLTRSMAPETKSRFTLARRLFGFLVKTVRNRNTRLALLELNDEQLKDIGISRCQAYGDGYSRYRRRGPDDDDAGADAR
ncbi:DUF1127 domain-containing protein [Rhizobium sp. RCAM05350]|nr:DUF1127 domain-containing protein [Rhizobium sp. RCAM05350]